MAKVKVYRADIYDAQNDGIVRSCDGGNSGTGVLGPPRFRISGIHIGKRTSTISNRKRRLVLMRSSDRCHCYREAIAQRQIDDSNPRYLCRGVTIIDKQPPTRAMRPNGGAFSMSGEFKSDLYAAPMLA
jgi:hypothetical protein